MFIFFFRDVNKRCRKGSNIATFIDSFLLLYAFIPELHELLDRHNLLFVEVYLGVVQVLDRLQEHFRLEFEGEEVVHGVLSDRLNLDLSSLVLVVT